MKTTKSEKIIVSPDNTKLFFINTNTGTGINSVHEIDLTTDQVSEVIRYADSSIKQFVASEDASHFVIGVLNNNTSEKQLITYETKNLTVKYSTTINEYTPITMIDNQGENFYYADTTSDEFLSRSLNDGNLNWAFSATNETYYFSPYEKNSTTLVVSGNVNTYQIDKQSGNGTALYAPNTNPYLGGVFGRIEQQKFVNLNDSLISCITGFCNIGSFLEISIVDINNGTSTEIYRSRFEAGSFPVGKFVGENFFGGTLQAVPVLSHLWLLLSMILILLASLHSLNKTAANKPR